MFGSKNNNTLQYGVMLHNEAIVLESVVWIFGIATIFLAQRLINFFRPIK
jgi:hypothetical protein